MIDNYIAIIPAKSKSVGVPGKNISPIAGGKSLFERAILAALDSPSVSSLVVAVDGGIFPLAKEILIRHDRNKEIILLERPDILSDDTVQVDSVAWFAALEYKQRFNIAGTHTVVLQPTSPFRTKTHIEEAIELYEAIQLKRKSLISVGSLRKFLYSTDWLRSDVATEEANQAIYPVGHDPQKRLGRESYDTDEMLYYENGAIYICPIEHLLIEKTMRVDPYFPYVMDDESSIEIDTELDWKLMEAVDNG